MGSIGAPLHMADVRIRRQLAFLAAQLMYSRIETEYFTAKRKAAGQYGICAECGRPIPKARLAARPHATLCIECQRAREGQRQAQAS